MNKQHILSKIISVLVLGSIFITGCQKTETGVITDKQKETIETSIGQMYDKAKTDPKNFHTEVISFFEKYGEGITLDSGTLIGFEKVNLSLPNVYSTEYDDLFLDGSNIQSDIFSTLTDLSYEYSETTSYADGSFSFRVTVTGQIKDYNSTWADLMADTETMEQIIMNAKTNIEAAQSTFDYSFAERLEQQEMIQYTAVYGFLILNDGSIKVLSLAEADITNIFVVPDATRNILLENLGIYTLENIYEQDPDSLKGLFTEEEWEQIQATAN